MCTVVVTIRANFKPKRSAIKASRLNRVLMVVLGCVMVFTLVSFGLVVQIKASIQSEQSQAKTMAEVNNNLSIQQHRTTSFEKMMHARSGFEHLSEPKKIIEVATVPAFQAVKKNVSRAVDTYPHSFGY